MNRTLTIISLIVISLSTLSIQNNSSRTFAQFAINQDITINQSAAIDAYMSALPGIVISRADHITKSYYCIMEVGTSISWNEFITHFDNLGYTISCYNTGVKGTDSLIDPITLKNCTDD